MYFDKAANIYGNGLRVVLIFPEGRQSPLAIKLGFDCTNNMAKYEACLNGLQVAVTLGIKELDIFGDSALVIYQAIGEWQTKDSKLIPYQKYLTQLINKFDKVRFHYLSHDKNQFADALATLTVMVKLDCGIHVQPIRIEGKINPAYCLNVENEMKAYPWFHDIKNYVKSKEYHLEVMENDKKTIRHMAMNFFLSGDVLYKRTFDGALLRCVDSGDARKILEEVHEGICGTHANGHTMAKQVQRHGYFLLTIERVYIEYVKKCHKCHIYADRMHAPPQPLHNLVAP
ncbi:uncharacterized protein LOC129317538 [Prosopis cineraria]|uniref:uncharacterized protein LOC129317538 n=1 Tax=Prosopis cineraria TaxID=364024 RepID=UPI00241015EC|nr:uncharacterized protein LOC129317538 [Prosopis cineraria]